MERWLAIYLDRCPGFVLFLSEEKEELSVLLQEQEDIHQTCHREGWRCHVFSCSLVVQKKCIKQKFVHKETEAPQAN